MITIFEKIPELFIELYDSSFQVWAREFRIRGPRCAIEFIRPPGASALLDPEGRVIRKGAWLVAEPQDDGVMKISPASDLDAEIIERHVREMRPHVLQ